jgi:prepilin-type N-terminal cleavage/methylation domain-containing protein/prepilin-type processing-associated H-X9-DG protein
MRIQSSRCAFSLIELLVAISVMGILLGLTLNAVQSVRSAAARVSCANNLRQCMLASLAHHDAEGHLPQPSFKKWEVSSSRAVLMPWTNVLLPHLERGDLWRSIPWAYQLSPGYNSPPHVGIVTVVPTFACPADGRLHAPITDSFGYTAAYGSYQGVLSDDRIVRSAMDYVQKVRMTDVTDGTSQSLYLGERPPGGVAFSGNWYTLDVPIPDLPYTTGLVYASAIPVHADGGGLCQGPFHFGPGRVENPCDTYHFWSLHSGGANFGFVDGSVRFLRYSADSVLPALATRAGGEVVAIPD